MWTWGFLSAFDLAWILCLSRFTFSCLFSFEGLLIGLVALFLFIFSHFVTVCVFLCVISSVEFCFFAFTICLGVLSLQFFFFLLYFHAEWLAGSWYSIRELG